MIQRRLAIVILIGSLLMAGAATAAEPDLSGLARYFDTIDTLSGEFTQRTLDEQGALVEQAEGDFALARSQRFAWHYQTPWEQVIVSDGRRLWVHDVDLEQVVVRPLDEALGIGAAQLLSGDLAKLQADFQIHTQGPNQIELQPTDPAWDFQRIQLTLREGIPQRITIRDGLGQRIEVVLTDLQRNPSFAAERFAFQPPAGVDVLEGS